MTSSRLASTVALLLADPATSVCVYNNPVMVLSTVQWVRLRLI